MRVIAKWLEQGALPVVLGWRLGKAQEALHHLLKAGFRVACEEGIYDVARKYEDAGISFGDDYRIFDGTASADEVLLFPPGRKSREHVSQNRQQDGQYATWR